jgi:hypothetical protein
MKEQTNPAPIALFVYNRLWHTRQTVEALQKNFGAKESDLYIFSDGFKNESDKDAVGVVREYIYTIGGFNRVEIIEKEKNLGLAESIISGVTEVVNKLGKVIVLEDDLVTSPHFLEYMNEGLEIYKNDDKVASIHGYIYPIKEKLPETFFIKGADCWGWATWKRAWNKFEHDGEKLLTELERGSLTKDFDFGGNFHYTRMLKNQISGKTNSWAIRWYASAFLSSMLTLYPGKSLVKNIGHDSGTHKGSNIFQTEPTQEKILVEKIKVVEDQKNRKILERYFKSLKPTFLSRILKKLSWNS